MKYLLTVCVLLFSLSASAQWQQTGSRVRYVNGIGIPTKDTAAGVIADSSQILIRPADSSLYVKYKRTWIKVGGTGFTGSGTTGYIPRYTSSTSLGNSNIYENGSGQIGIFTAFPTAGESLTILGSILQVQPISLVETTVKGTSMMFTTLTDVSHIGTKSNHLLGLITNNSVRAAITTGGQLNIGGNYSSTNNTLQVAGNMAIGTTTAAPTNGLLVSGNVGIGTENPGDILDIRTNVNTSKFIVFGNSNTGASTRTSLNMFTDAGGGDLRVEVNNAANTADVGAAGVKIWNHANAALSFGTNSTDRMRITSGGEVLIQNTDNGAYNLQCNGTGVWGAGAYVNGSDSALKENIQNIDSSLALVKLLKPVTYKYKKQYSSDSTIQTGFIAQDLQNVFKNKSYLSGLVKEGGKHLSVAYQNIIPILTKAIQEQQDKIQSLEKRLAALEAILKNNKIQ